MSHPKVIANWKMNGSKEAIQIWLEGFANEINPTAQKECLFCPPVIYLETAKTVIRDKDLNLSLGAQNLDIDSLHSQTGAVSASMLKDVGCEFVIIGHSERRTLFNEDNLLLRTKVISALEGNLAVVFCVGETEKEDSTSKDLIRKQLEALRDFCKPKIVIAYEPLWAIGTGEIPSGSYLNDMHSFIKDELKYILDKEQDFSVYYGGSINAENANDLMNLDCVDGLLVGGASLDSSSFVQIINKIYS